MTKKKVSRPYVGLNIGDTTQDNSKASKRSKIMSATETRATVMSVTPGGPAANAGIQVGDIIYEIDGKKIANVNDFLDAIGVETGKEITLKIKRSTTFFGSESIQDVEVRLVTQPMDQPARYGRRK